MRRWFIAVSLAAGLLALPEVGMACSRVSISATPIAFGTYRPNQDLPRTTSARIDVSCRDNLVVEQPYELRISEGNSGRFERRFLTDGSNRLDYNLFTEASLRSILGDGSGRSNPLRSSFGLGESAQHHLIYGLIPARQAVPSGTYVDTVIISIAF